MTFGSYAYASSEYAGAQVTQTMECPQPPSCNLIIMNSLGQYLEQPPGHLNLNDISRYIDNIICISHSKMSAPRQST